MGNKCFISYKKEDQAYRDELDNVLESADVINKGLDRTIDSDDGDYIMQTIRNEYLKDSTVTLFLIGTHSSEYEGYDSKGQRKNYFIEHELQASLYDGDGNTRNGILGVILPEMDSKICGSQYQCPVCGNMHQIIRLDDATVIREFHMNCYIEPHSGCAWSEDERYCVLVRWEDFIDNPTHWIDCAYNKRDSEIAEKVKVRNFR